MANTVTLSTNFNVAPYYDDFDESKNFHRILFRPGLAVQARELTQVQSILQNQIDRFAEHIFKEGSIVKGCESVYDQKYFYIKLRNNTLAGASVNVSSFLNSTISGANKKVRALVIKVADGAEANTPNFKTLFVKYTGANTDGTKYIANSEVITAPGGLTANVISVSGTGLGTAITFKAGIIFAKDHFIRVSEQTLILEKYSTEPTYKVGYDISESIVSDSDDTTLLDPANGSYNFTAPGATRLKLTATLVKKSATVSSANNFVEMMQIKDGIIQVLSDKPEYSSIRDYIAKRTSDESGDYIVNGLSLRLKEHLKSGNNGGVFTSGQGGNTSLISVEMEPGTAYIRGYDIEKIVTTRISIDKATDYESVEQSSLLADYGNYVIVDNVVGKWDVNGQDQVSLRDTQANSVSTGNFAITTFPGAQIGTARVRALEYYTGTPGLPSAQYKMYLSDISITTAGKGFSNVQSICFSAGSGSANGKADIFGSNGKNANTTDPSFDYAVFKIPAKAIRRLRDTSGAVDTNFEFMKAFDVSFDASGQSTLNTGDASETYSGSGTLSDSATRERFYVTMRSSGNTSTLTGTVTITSSSNAVTGTGTAFTTQVNPGDIIACSPTDNFVVSSVTNNTSLTLVSGAAASRAGAYHKKFKQGQVIDLGGVGRDGNRSISISSSTSALVDINETLNSPSSLNAVITTVLNKVDGQEASKTVNRNRLVQLHVGSNRGGSGYTANVAGPWPLGLSDGFKLISVRQKSGSDFSTVSQGTDVTSHFTLNSGMLDSKYDHAKLVKKSTSGLAIASGDRFLVKFDYFTHSYSSGKGYFSVDSYPVNDTTAGSDTTKIYTYQIPIFTSPVDGISYDLRDSVDIRPRTTDTANSVTVLTNIATNPLSSTSFDEPSGGLHFIPPGESFAADLDYYLKRKDSIVLTKDGIIKSIRGVPSLFPVTPQLNEDGLHLGTISLAPYPSLSSQVARDNSRQDLSCGVVPVRNERYTMKDIGAIRDRVDRLEYYTSLSLLEKDAKDMLIQDSSGNDRFKNGILVDSFTGHNIGNVYDSDYKISIDPQKGEARPPFKLDNVELFYKSSNTTSVVRTNVTPGGVSKDQVVSVSNSTILFSNGENITSGAFTAKLTYQIDNKLYIENATGNFVAAATVTGGTTGNVATISSVSTVSPGDLITLPYTHETFVSQPYASTTRNSAGLMWNWAGVMTITPDNDYWVDTVQRPDVQLNFDMNSDNWAVLANAWGTQWNDWQTVWTGQQTVATNEISNGVFVQGNQIIESFNNQSTIEITNKLTRTGQAFTTVPTTQTQSTGALVKDVNIRPFIRSRVVQFSSVGMKPNTRLYSFFDGTDVSAYVTPTNSSYTASGVEGASLASDNTGSVYGLLRIPGDESLRFRAGERKFRLTDNPTNSSALGSFVTSAEAFYMSQGLVVGTQDTTISTRGSQLVSTTPEEHNTLTSYQNIITGTGQRVIGEIPESDGQGDGGGGGDDDPIAQSFLVNTISTRGLNSSGIYVTKLDLYFSSKDANLPVTVEIREIDIMTGAVTGKVVPFGRKILFPAAIHTSSNSSKPTQFIFPAPVFLQNDKEYCFVIIPGGNNPNYNVFISRLGEVDLISGNRISSQPAAGVLFASANDRVFTPIQEEDIKFTLYTATFTTSTSGTVIFKNENRDYLTIANVSSGFTRVGETIHGETLLTGTFANTKSVNTNVCFVQGMTSGATGTIASFSPTKIMAKSVSLTPKFAGGERIRIRNTNATTGVIIGNSSIGITSTTPTGVVMYYDPVTASNTFLHVANTSYVNSGAAASNNRMFTSGQYVRGQTNGYTARIVTINNLKADVINFTTDYLAPLNSTVTFTGKFATSTSTKDGSYIKINTNSSTEFGSSRYILSRSVESNTSASSSTMTNDRSFEIKALLDSDNELSSPALDVRRISVTTVENLINSNTTIGSSEDYVKSGGNAKARYITRKVSLADGQDAEDLKLFVTAYKPAGAGIHAYYKVLHREDSDTFSDARWIPMNQSTAETVISDSQDTETFREYEYDIPTYGNTNKSGANTTNSSILEYRNTASARFIGFKYFAIKIVLTNDSSVKPPRLSDLRVIALQR